MTSELAKLALATAKKIKTDAQVLALPPSESAVSIGHPVLPITLFKRCNRGYIIKVVHQINRTYMDASYDACSVMIRRLVETLIIEVFEHQGIDHKIKEPNGDFKTLKHLIADAIKEPWNLSKNSRNGLNNMKDIGDWAAHTRRFNAHREDIDNIKGDLRVAVQDLLTLAGMY